MLREYLRHFRIRDSRKTLKTLGVSFARLPYENLTKIIKWTECGPSPQARRAPQEVVSDHVSLGTGGTCFSLTATLLHLVRSLGYQAEPILADRRYGQNTHCALLVWIGGRGHLLDPGYLVVDPLPLPAAEAHLKTEFNELVLVPAPGGNTMELRTAESGASRHRLTYKLDPVDPREFLKIWDESFSWEMMRYPLLTRADHGRQLYMRGSRFQVRTPESVDHREIPPEELPARIASEFRIAPSIAARALSILRERGERLG